MEGQVCSFHWECSSDPFQHYTKDHYPKQRLEGSGSISTIPQTHLFVRGQHNLVLKQRQFWMSTKFIWRVYLMQHLKLLESCATVPPALALYPIAFVHEILKFVVWLMTTRQKWVLTRPILGRNVYYNYSLHVPLKWVTTCNHQQNIIVKRPSFEKETAVGKLSMIHIL